MSKLGNQSSIGSECDDPIMVGMELFDHGGGIEVDGVELS
jgi:hypothetical protein